MLGFKRNFRICVFALIASVLSGCGGEKLAVSGVEITGRPGFQYISGTAKNTSRSGFNYSSITFKLYDGDTVVGDAKVNVYSLGAGESWKFKTQSYKNFNRVTVAEIYTN